MPLGEASAIRASFSTHESDGFMKNTRLGTTGYGADDTNLTLRYMSQVSDKLKVDFKFSSVERKTITAIDARQNNPIINTGYAMFGLTRHLTMIEMIFITLTMNLLSNLTKIYSA